MGHIIGVVAPRQRCIHTHVMKNSLGLCHCTCTVFALTSCDTNAAEFFYAYLMHRLQRRSAFRAAFRSFLPAVTIGCCCRVPSELSPDRTRCFVASSRSSTLESDATSRIAGFAIKCTVPIASARSLRTWRACRWMTVARAECFCLLCSLQSCSQSDIASGVAPCPCRITCGDGVPSRWNQTSSLSAAVHSRSFSTAVCPTSIVAPVRVAKRRTIFNSAATRVFAGEPAHVAATLSSPVHRKLLSMGGLLLALPRGVPLAQANNYRRTEMP
eukprot:COSAG02_NODE_16247_length_1099_cov_2.073000_1_plen_270_part_10